MLYRIQSQKLEENLYKRTTLFNINLEVGNQVNIKLLFIQYWKISHGLTLKDGKLNEHKTLTHTVLED